MASNESMDNTYTKNLTELRQAYDHGADYRDQLPISPWKVKNRQRFLQRLQQENKKRLLEIGAGAGHDGLFFQQAGLDVVCTDLSQEMVKRCQAKGLKAYQADFLSLREPAETFDAIFAMNCLLHVASAELPQVLKALARVLKPGGLFFLGAYAGDSEGIWPEDSHTPPRFFALRSEAAMKAFLTVDFELVDVQIIPLAQEDFQGFTLRKPLKKPLTS